MEGEIQLTESETHGRLVKTEQPIYTLQMVSQAMSSGMSTEDLKVIMDLHERHEANEAKKAYHQAFAAFKANPPKIVKDMQVDYSTSKGRTNYRHASIGNVVSSTIAGLGEHGLSHQWLIDQSGDKIKVNCVLTHSLGHSESTSMEAAPDQSGGKNNIQAIASTTTYLERYTLLAITGMATSEMDDDGRGGITPEKILDGIKWFVSEGKTADALDKWLGDKAPDIKRMSKADQEKIDVAEAKAIEALETLHDKPPETYTCPQGGRIVTDDECNECEVKPSCEIHKGAKND